MVSAIKDFILFLLLLTFLFVGSYKAKNYLSATKKSIVKEFINIPFAMKSAKLLFLGRNIAASQYYQFLAIVYNTKLKYPHYHLIKNESGNNHKHKHRHPLVNETGEKYVAYTHGIGGKDVYLTQKQLEEMQKREMYINEHVSEFIDIDYFYNLIDLSNALDDNNDYILVYGKGWVLNADMARKMIKVLMHSYERNPQWRKVFDAGWIALYYIRDYDLARKYLRMAASHPNAPDFVSIIYSYSFYIDKKYEIAIVQLKEQIKNTTDHNLKTRLMKRLEWYKSLLTLNRAAKLYKKKFGKDINSLKDLVKAGLIEKIPRDNIGKGFVWDEKNKEVISKNVYDLIRSNKNEK